MLSGCLAAVLVALALEDAPVLKRSSRLIKLILRLLTE